MRTYVRYALGAVRAVETEAERSLPGLETERVRTFDAPEALGINFHEVRAKSALNKVPGHLPAVQLDRQRLQGLLPRLHLLLRPQHPHLPRPDAGRDFEREIVVKVNVPELLARRAAAGRRWKRELVAFGTNTDPYQWAEGRYELMPPMLEALREPRRRPRS